MTSSMTNDSPLPFDLSSPEAEHYDRKQEFHSNNAELLHEHPLLVQLLH